jgi:hypothetical protein
LKLPFPLRVSFKGIYVNGSPYEPMKLCRVLLVVRAVDLSLLLIHSGTAKEVRKASSRSTATEEIQFSRARQRMILRLPRLHSFLRRGGARDSITPFGIAATIAVVVR